MTYNQNETRKKVIAVSFDRIIATVNPYNQISVLGESLDTVWDLSPRAESIQWLKQLVDTYDVHIVSYRSCTLTERMAMKSWLKYYLRNELGTAWYKTYRSIKFPWRLPKYDLLVDDLTMKIGDSFPHMIKLSQELDR